MPFADGAWRISERAGLSGDDVEQAAGVDVGKVEDTGIVMLCASMRYP
jgi:hypothetical protein